MTVEPLRFEDGALLILDQRALPGEERWIRCERPAEVADCIRTLAVRGAPAIGIAAAYGMALVDGERGERLASAGDLLRSARPTAVNLAWAVDQVLASGDALACARRLHREQDAADRRLAALGAERFEPGDRALTHCNTGALATAGYGTAGGVLRAAWDRGRLEQVWVDETRPLNQGARLTTWELERAGIPHRLVTDSSAGTLMARGLVDRIVVGADRIAANGDVANKVGTYPLAVVAERHGAAVLRGGAGLDDRSPHPGWRVDPDRGARRVRARRRGSRGELRLRRDPRRARDGDRDRGRSARAALRGGHRGCRFALRWWPPGARCCGSAWWPAPPAT